MLLIDGGPDPSEVDQLLLQLETGLPKEALNLVNGPVPLLRGEYLSLFNKGIIIVEQMMALSKDEINKHVGTLNLAHLNRILDKHL